jgi:hypothetical protein
MTFEMIKSILNICLATLRYKVEAVLKTCGVFVYGDICCVTNLFRINVLNTATHSLCCELHCFIHFSYYCRYVIVAHDVKKNVHVPLFMQLCYTYWFFNLCTALRVVRMQTKFCRRWQKVQRTCWKALVVFCVRKSWWSTLAYEHPPPPLWCNTPMRAKSASFVRFVDHTQWRITVGRTPLDEGSARRRELYLKTYNSHNRQTSMTQLGLEPGVPASVWLQTLALELSATGISGF